MPVPDFSPGEVLTAAAMDSIGMWLVSTTTIGAGVASVTVTGAFSADFDNYKIVFSGFGASSLGSAAYLKLNNSTGSTYFGNMIYNVPTSSAIAGVSAANGISLGFFVHTVSTTGTNSFEAMINSPFLAVTSNCVGNFSGRSYNGQFSGHDSNAASSTGFIFAPGSGTVTGGTIKIYGYRN